MNNPNSKQLDCPCVAGESQMVDLHANQAGATALEWTLLLAAIAIPSFYILTLALNLLVEHYRMMTLLNSLPFP